LNYVLVLFYIALTKYHTALKTINIPYFNDK
jgi:hypothetical protein